MRPQGPRRMLSPFLPLDMAAASFVALAKDGSAHLTERGNRGSDLVQPYCDMRIPALKTEARRSYGQRPCFARTRCGGCRDRTSLQCSTLNLSSLRAARSPPNEQGVTMPGEFSSTFALCMDLLIRCGIGDLAHQVPDDVSFFARASPSWGYLGGMVGGIMGPSWG